MNQYITLKKGLRLFWVFAMLITTTIIARGELRLPAIFGDHMVLQQGVKAPVWGWATPGQTVTVSFAGKKVSGKVHADGRWQVKLPVPNADGKAGELVITAGEERKVFTDVLAGEVWVCSGQSNMKEGVGETLNAKEAITGAVFPQIRLFQVDMWCSPHPLADVHGGKWEVCSPATVGKFTAVGYFFGRELYQMGKTPMGMIDSSSGGTAAEAAR